MRALFVKPALSWPRLSGHDVHAFHMMKALAALGVDVSLATLSPPSRNALDGFCPSSLHVLNGGDTNASVGITRLQERFRRYWGVSHAAMSFVRQVADACRADAVIAVGLDVLPYLAAVEGPVRIWYAADEWVRHHLTQMRGVRGSAWAHMRQAVIKGLYERAFASVVDRVWVVSDEERRAMRWFGGMPTSDIVPNGVDADFYAPVACDQISRSVVFWGRLDFGPNVQALEWFCRHVWPSLIRRAPDARFTMIGANPSATVRTLAAANGITLLPDLADLREEAGSHSVVVLPFVSGGGIKNKLLEAASLEKAVVCSPSACGGLRVGAPVLTVSTRSPEAWVRAIEQLWADEAWRQRLGRDARAWVLKHHTWQAAARTVLSTLSRDVARRDGR